MLRSVPIRFVRAASLALRFVQARQATIECVRCERLVQRTHFEFELGPACRARRKALLAAQKFGPHRRDALSERLELWAGGQLALQLRQMLLRSFARRPS